MLWMIRRRHFAPLIALLIYLLLIGSASTAVAQGEQCLDSGNTICVDSSGNAQISGDVIAEGSIGAGGGIISVGNPNPDSNAGVSLMWRGDVARLRLTGEGPGVANGFEIAKPGEKVLFKVDNGGSVWAPGTIGAGGGIISVDNPNPDSNAGVSLMWRGDVARLRLTGEGPGVANGFEIAKPGEKVLFKVDNGGNVTVPGKTQTQVLEITGGSDLAEPFAVAEEENIQPGMVVAIDPNTPGQLRLATRAYDRGVAGVVSGAGGIQPGMTMQQTDLITENDLPVALTGRVYVWADASYGAIQPSDLLTASDTPGHAMKVVDYEQSQGAILGKAMTGLDEGVGLVLVLVALQ